MNNLFKIQTSALPLAIVAMMGTLNAQTTKPLETSTDEKYSNTTIVYRNDKNASDAVILAQIEKEYGMGDVVRIAEAPPKAKATPVLAKATTIKPATVKPAVAAAPASIQPIKSESVAVRTTQAAPKTTVSENDAPAKPAVQWVASDDRAAVMQSIATAPASARNDYSDASQRPEATQKVALKTAATVLTKTTTAKTTAAKTNTASSSNTQKTNTAKTTGKLYKHKSKSHFNLNFKLLPKSGKQSYRCYRF